MSRDDRRAQILHLAQELFARQGFHHVSMDDIAERAEVSKPVLYRHFPSKLDLYLAVVDQRGEELVAAVDAEVARATAPGSPPSGFEVVRAIIEAYVAFVEHAGDTVELLFESDVTRDTEVRARVEHASRLAAETVCRGLEEQTALSHDQAALLAEVLVGMARATATSRHRSDAVPASEAVDLVSALAWRGVAGLVRPRGSGPDGADSTGGTGGTGGTDGEGARDPEVGDARDAT